MKLLNMQLKNVFQKNILNTFGENLYDKIDIQPTTNKKFGDFQTNFAMINSKTLSKNPREIASTLLENFDKENIVEKLEIAGPGFINIFLKNSFVNEEIKKIDKEAYDFSFLDNDRKIIIDYSSPNIAKRMHVAHLRSTIIGDAIKRIYQFLGFEIIADNHIGDWGTQFGKLIVSYNNWLDKDNYAKDPIEELERIYVQFSKEAEKNPELEDLARKELNKLQSGDPVNNELWKEFIAISLKEYNKVYDRLDIKFDLYNGESFYNDMMPAVIQELKDKNIAKEDNDALVVFFDESTNLHPCIVQKKDGSFLYSTSDLATARYKRETLKVDEAIYITDERQQDHFKQVFAISEMLGEPYNFEKHHAWFGIMRFNDGSIFSSRKGNIVRLIDLLDEAREHVKKIVAKKNPDMSSEEVENISDTIGTGAIKYFDLSQNRTSDITFDWKTVLSFEGNTGPYLQYTYVRIMSILRKIKEDNYTYDDSKDIITELSTDLEKELAVQLLNLPMTVVNAYKTLKPNVIAEYLFNTAKLFNQFYNSTPIFKEENKDLRDSRILLSLKTAHVLKDGLNILGIKTVEKM